MSGGFFPGMPTVNFSRVGAKSGEILFYPFETKKTAFFAKYFIWKCQISKSMGPSGPAPLSDAHAYKQELGISQNEINSDARDALPGDGIALNVELRLCTKCKQKTIKFKIHAIVSHTAPKPLRHQLLQNREHNRLHLQVSVIGKRHQLFFLIVTALHASSGLVHVDLYTNARIATKTKLVKTFSKLHDWGLMPRRGI